MEDLKSIGQVYIHHTRPVLENMAQGPVSVDFFETFMDEISRHYDHSAAMGNGYLSYVEKIGNLLDQKLGADRNKAVEWLETSSEDFGGAKPIELICVGKAQLIADYLENNLIQNQ